VVLRADRGGLDRRGVVPLAEGGGVVAVGLQHLGDGRGGLRDHPGVAVEGDRPLGDGAGADAGVVAPGQQRGPRRRADRGGVELLVGDAAPRCAVPDRRSCAGAVGSRPGGAAARRALGLLLIAFGLLTLTGLDRMVQTALGGMSPQWLTDLTTRF